METNSTHMSTEATTETEPKLNDDELATLLESKADALRSGSRPRDDVVRETLKLLGDEPDVVERGYVNVDGRISFGREHAGEDGVGLFMPDDE